MHENTYAVNGIFTYDVVEEVDSIDAHNACICILIQHMITLYIHKSSYSPCLHMKMS